MFRSGSSQFPSRLLARFGDGAMARSGRINPETKGGEVHSARADIEYLRASLCKPTSPSYHENWRWQSVSQCTAYADYQDILLIKDHITTIWLHLQYGGTSSGSI